MLTEAERESLTRCDCGHDIGGEHNSYGCYGGGPACGCRETDDRPGVNFAAVERILATRDRAERALERVEALADEWAEDYPSDLAACNYAADHWWRSLRAALGGPTCYE